MPKIINEIDMRPDSFALIERGFRPCRYWLHRRFDRGNGFAVFLMLNPSKADATINDPTTTRCIGFARRWHVHTLILVNLFPVIATDPDELLEFDLGHYEDDKNIKCVMRAGELVSKHGGHFVCAWGNHRAARSQAAVYSERLMRRFWMLKHLGLTKEGQPRHPLYVPSDAELYRYGR